MVQPRRDYLRGGLSRAVEIRQRLARSTRPPVTNGWGLWSAIGDYEGDSGRPSDELIRFALDALSTTVDLRLDELAARCHGQVAEWIPRWPGEHYRLLAALVRTSKASTAIEIGTYLGPGALALAAGSPEVRVVTYDVVPWQDFPETELRPEDFTDRFEQRIGDLGDPAYMATQIDTLREADLVFFDGPKDGHWEHEVIPTLLRDLSDRRRLVVFDDIRFVEMVDFWRKLPFEKLDLSGFGHWSGSGILWTA